jgi:hypothetical protein
LQNVLEHLSKLHSTTLQGWLRADRSFTDTAYGARAQHAQQPVKVEMVQSASRAHVP